MKQTEQRVVGIRRPHGPTPAGRRPRLGPSVSGGASPSVKRSSTTDLHPVPRGMPDPADWAKHLSVAIVDVMGGRREARSIQRWMTPEVYNQIRAVSQRTRWQGGSMPALAMTARACSVAPDSVEFAVTIWDQDRARAVAGRLKMVRTRWQLNEFETQ
ncbi:Rv3235 family protein [Actinomyces minihominis]|uniref:Rv3235 family protein n=1 Tax=Actinomyces minihominis TaxID=2002838 RepID=UPI000C06EC0C|nr:Rv3235 family protein [Actinomyces minihominis]